MAKLPREPDIATLRSLGPDLARLPAGTSVWRIHRTSGPHPAGWDERRVFGPSKTARFDPHSEPARIQEGVGVVYLARDVPTALAEAYQATRVVTVRRNAPYLTGFTTAADLELLDLTGGWPLRAGASHTTNAGRRDVARRWVRAFVEVWPDLHGLLYTSSMTGRTCVALYMPGRHALPGTPAFSEPLSCAGLTNHLADAANEIGYLIDVR